MSEEKRRRAMRSAMKQLLALPPDEKTAARLAAAGVEPENINRQTALLEMLYEKAAGGDIRAFQEVCSIVGEIRESQLDLREQRAKIRKLELENRSREPCGDSGEESSLLTALRQAAEGGDPGGVPEAELPAGHGDDLVAAGGDEGV